MSDQIMNSLPFDIASVLPSRSPQMKLAKPKKNATTAPDMNSTPRAFTIVLLNVFMSSANVPIPACTPVALSAEATVVRMRNEENERVARRKDFFMMYIL